MAEHVAQLELLHLVDGVGVKLVEFGLVDEPFFHEVEARGHLLGGVCHFVAAVDPKVERLYFFHLCLGGFLVVPEVGYMGAEFFFLHFDAFAVHIQVTVQGGGALLQVFELLLGNHFC